MTSPDELYTLRNLFWLGNYQVQFSQFFVFLFPKSLQAAISEANSLNRIPKQWVSQRDEYVYRSYLGLGQYDIVIGEIQDNASTDLKSLRLLALFLSKNLPLQETLIEMDKLHQSATNFSSGTFFYVLATLHVYGDSIKDALNATDSNNSLEL